MLFFNPATSIECTKHVVWLLAIICGTTYLGLKGSFLRKYNSIDMSNATKP